MRSPTIAERIKFIEQRTAAELLGGSNQIGSHHLDPIGVDLNAMVTPYRSTAAQGLRLFFEGIAIHWILNRAITFSSVGTRDKLPDQWLRFPGANAVGGLVNFVIYSVLVRQLPVFAVYPVMAVAVGSLVGLGINFALSRAFIFCYPI